MITLLKLLTSGMVGFICSRLFYGIMHKEEVPEMFRYSFGVTLVAIMSLLFLDDETERRSTLTSVLLAAVGVGAGVGANRLLGDD